MDQGHAEQSQKMDAKKKVSQTDVCPRKKTSAPRKVDQANVSNQKMGVKRVQTNLKMGVKMIAVRSFSMIKILLI